MKKKVRKLITLSASTIMAATSLITTTYAWFKINSIATVENIDFEVVGGLGVEVSVDGVHYQNDLQLLQLQKAVAASFDPGTYEVKGYVLNENNEEVDSPDTLYKNGVALTDEEAVDELSAVMKQIKLLPATTKDGITLTDLYNSKYSSSSGRYMEFGVYFKTTSDKASDKLKYDVYLNGYEGKDNEGNQVVRTVFTSDTTSVPLSADMRAVIPDGAGGKVVTDLKSAEGANITVYSSNAARISTTVANKTLIPDSYYQTNDLEYNSDKTYYVISEGQYVIFTGDAFDEDTTYYEYQEAYYTYLEDVDTSLIYEINDTEYINTDLGSYATNYSTYNPDDTTSDNYYLYDCNCNAMYTYYNNLRTQDNGLLDKELDYEDMPQNIIRTLPAKSSSVIKKASTIAEADDSNYYPMVTLESGDEAKLINFRVWIEGWDADCFDGLSNSIDMRLAFASKRVY
ncbi:MAG: hypothetical protein K6E20_01170 [Acholeplasmatales bacterium]|nr:hypothetical protein [Acholeplasmatales bacterium]